MTPYWQMTTGNGRQDEAWISGVHFVYLHIWIIQFEQSTFWLIVAGVNWWTLIIDLVKCCRWLNLSKPIVDFLVLLSSFGDFGVASVGQRYRLPLLQGLIRKIGFVFSQWRPSFAPTDWLLAPTICKSLWKSLWCKFVAFHPNDTKHIPKWHQNDTQKDTILWINE